MCVCARVRVRARVRACVNTLPQGNDCFKKKSLKYLSYTDKLSYSKISLILETVHIELAFLMHFLCILIMTKTDIIIDVVCI